ncbi:MAG: HAD-IA family hydrolase [Zymomonas mobilis]|uniref:HAD-IA family hydrolase n=1 Tax=Zymomonas mobilis TaxID=542 RepID=UPI0039E9B3B5
MNLKEIKLCPNKGRNFGPLFVEFSDKISKYDLFCHLHSKKSLYSGREQFQWSNYLLEYLAKDQEIIIKLLNAFSEKEDIGIYYPTSFWMMPSWVNHMLSNSGSIQFWEKKFGLEINDEFFAYPVGGMFWARPKAIQQVLDANLKYEDMPPEPLPNDGSILHALERAISFLVEKNNYKQLFYYPYSNNLSFDKKYIFESYNKSLNASLNHCLKFDYISFDLFDTLVSRKYTSSEYAKLKLGKEIVSLGFVNDPNTFIKIRNESEQELRKEKKFKGDVKIDEIYKRIAKKLDLSNEYLHMFLKREFELDLDMIEPNYKIIEFFQNAIKLGKKIFIISDTYYSLNQIKMILEKVGIIDECNILLSSETGLRKDNGTMWNYVKNDLCLHKKNYLHIGDNVVSDAQLPGDFGLQTFHILHPLDKWKNLGFPTVMKKNEIDEYKILKWGKLINKANNF